MVSLSLFLLLLVTIVVVVVVVVVVVAVTIICTEQTQHPKSRHILSYTTFTNQPTIKIYGKDGRNTTALMKRAFRCNKTL